MIDKTLEYSIDKEKLIDIRITYLSNTKMHVSIYNDRNDTYVAYTCGKEELKGLADFIYKTIGENNE
jgi:hypothetical protein